MYPDIVHGWAIPERHLSEAAFLWERLDAITLSPRHTLEDAVAQEQRLLAHLDGLVIGGEPVATYLLKPALEEDDTSLVRAAAAALLAQDAQADGVLGLLAEETEPRLSALRKALERCEREDLAARLAALPPLLPDAARAAVLEVQALRGLDAGASLPQWLKSETPALVVAALRATRAAPGRVAPGKLHGLMESPEPAVRDAALELGLRLGLRSAWKHCQRLVARQEPGCRRAMELLALGGEPADVEALLALTRVPGLRAEAVWALGFSGHAAVAEAALGWMRDKDTRFARLAAEAFSAITGLPLEGAYLREEEAGAEKLPPLEEDLDVDLTPAPEADLPLAWPDRVAAWWKDARGRFSPQLRYLRGRPLDTATLLEALAREPMRRRHLLALEVTLRNRGAPHLETRASALHQRQWLLQPPSLRDADLRAPLRQLLTLE
jgi:uncharacterized protein (TIGR02270 family)